MLRSLSALLLVPLLSAAPPPPAALPVCTGGEFTTRDGIRVAVRLDLFRTARIELRLPIPTRNLMAGPHRFQEDSALLISTEWPRGPAPMTGGVVWGGYPDPFGLPGGTLQLSCGRRNMGLVNFSINLGPPSMTSPGEDLRACIEELERDGAYALSFDRRGTARTFLRGTLRLSAARRAAERYAARAFARADAGQCVLEDLLATGL